MSRPGGTPAPPAQPLGIGVVLLFLAAGLAGVVWAGAQLAARLGRGQWLPAGLGVAAEALFRLPGHASEPRLAWPPELAARLPGPVVYWVCTALVMLAALATAAGVYRFRPRSQVGPDRRDRLGVETEARMAAVRDLKPLVVPGPSKGRFILGRVGRRLVATENRGTSTGRRGPREGDRSAVCVIGPTRCGKTANTIASVLEWDGPAVLSSVKADLLEATLRRRSEMGDVKIFDPTGITGKKASRWSPIWNAGTLVGAQKAAAALSAARPLPADHTATMDFFSGMAEQLLWPLFYTAKVSRRSMSDVVRWLLTFDHPSPGNRGQVGTLLDARVASADADARGAAEAALMTLGSIWRLDDRTRSDIYVTAQELLAPWQDPKVAASSVKPDITLDWLMRCNNTLYVCAPLNEQKRLATVLGGVVSDLIQHAYEWEGRKRSRLPDTLVVLDEAANTPTQWLPQVVSTCSGVGILLVTVWQSKAQIDASYGALADSVLTNHGTKVFFSGISDPATSEYASRLLGQEDVMQRSTSTDVAWGRHSVSDSATQRPLVPSHVLRQMPSFHALLIHGTLRPAHLVARQYYAERHLKAMSDVPSAEKVALAISPWATAVQR